MGERLRYLRALVLAEPPTELKQAPKRRWWFYKPELHFADWLPMYRGHDEYSRRTIVMGWPITGRVVIATNYCGEPECYAESLENLDMYLGIDEEVRNG